MHADLVVRRLPSQGLPLCTGIYLRVSSAAAIMYVRWGVLFELPINSKIQIKLTTVKKKTKFQYVSELTIVQGTS